MSASTVLTLGYGSFGSVNRLPTLGYATQPAITGFGRLEYTLPRSQLEYTLDDGRLEFTLADERLEFSGKKP